MPVNLTNHAPIGKARGCQCVPRKSKNWNALAWRTLLKAAANFKKQCFLFTGKSAIILPASVSDGFSQGVSRSTFP
jgi:hypothetical protein